MSCEELAPVDGSSGARDARTILGPEGPLANEPTYELRSGQLEMAEAVERALGQGRVLFCEAGTGTGKTLAYLAAAVLSGQRVVISTATKALEDQIVEREVPRLARALGRPLDVSVAKGLSNYLCLRRYHEMRRDPKQVYQHRRSLPVLDQWARETRSGDLGEANELSEDDPLIAEVISGADTRIGSSCEYFDECFVTRMKRRIQSSQIIVVNHHLFFADLAVKHRAAETAARVGVLPSFEAVVFDEAHRIEDVISTFFGVRTSERKVATLLRDADRAAEAHRLDVRPITAAAARDARHFFDIVSKLGPREAGDSRRPLAPDAFGPNEHRAHEALHEALTILEDYADGHAVSQSLESIARRARSTREELEQIVEPATHHVRWIDTSGQTTVLGASLIDVGPVVRDLVVGKLGGVVFTSATLTSVRSSSEPSGFGFFRKRVGLDEGSPYPADEVVVESPFDFDKSSLLYTPRDMPDVQDDAFRDAVIARAILLIEAAGGGALVLTTSVRAMKNLGAGLSRGLGREVLTQGDAPKSTLLERFRADGHGVLVATMGFWEGVDVPGEALRLVIIDRLPFAVPTDAVVAARAQAVRERGLDPFAAYSVPDAAITLKQGIGRLLRRRSDWGVSAVLDRRIVTRGYGHKILAALPIKRRTERLDDVRAFFAMRQVAGKTTTSD